MREGTTLRETYFRQRPQSPLGGALFLRSARQPRGPWRAWLDPYTHTHTYTYINVNNHTHTLTYNLWIWGKVWGTVCVCLSMHICKCVCLCVCVCVCVSPGGHVVRGLTQCVSLQLSFSSLPLWRRRYGVHCHQWAFTRHENRKKPMC